MNAQQFVISLFILAVSSAPLKAEKIGLFYDHSVPQFEFAASDIKTALEGQNIEVELLPIAKLSARYKNPKIVITLKANDEALNS